MFANVFGIHMDEGCQNMAAVVQRKTLYMTEEMTFTGYKGQFFSPFVCNKLQLCLSAPVTSVRALSHERQSPHLRSLTHETI